MIPLHLTFQRDSEGGENQNRLGSDNQSQHTTVATYGQCDSGGFSYAHLLETTLTIY